jgi:hypothetical protein
MVEASTDDMVERSLRMRRFLKNPQYAGQVDIESAGCGMLCVNADSLIDENGARVGYQAGLLVKDTLFYEQVEARHSRHLIRAIAPQTALQGAIGKRLGDIVDDIGLMTGVWNPEARITGIETVKGRSHLIVPVPSWPVDLYIGEDAHA